MSTKTHHILEAFIRQVLQENIQSEEALSKLKKRLAKRHGVDTPSNIQVIKTYHHLRKTGDIEESTQ